MATQYQSCNCNWLLSCYAESITQSNFHFKWSKHLSDLYKPAFNKEISSLTCTLYKIPLSMPLKFSIIIPSGSLVKESPSTHGSKLNLFYHKIPKINVLSFFSKLISTMHSKLNSSELLISKSVPLWTIKKFNLPKSHFFNIKSNPIKSQWWVYNLKYKKEGSSNQLLIHSTLESMDLFINKL